MPSEIHSVIFDKAYYSQSAAKKELSKMGLKPIKNVDITKNYLRYRIQDPSKYSKFAIKNTSKNMKLVLGFY